MQLFGEDGPDQRGTTDARLQSQLFPGCRKHSALSRRDIPAAQAAVRRNPQSRQPHDHAETERRELKWALIQLASMKKPTGCFALLLCAITACSSGVDLKQSANGTMPAPQTTPTQTAPNSDLQNELAQVAAKAKGRVGVSALVLETGETVSLNPNDHFPMQSVYKLPIGMVVMKQIDEGKIKLDQKVRVVKDDFVPSASHSPIRDKYPNGVELTVDDLMGWMLKESDGTASDVLMKLAGGPQSIQTYLDELNITSMIVL